MISIDKSNTPICQVSAPKASQLSDDGLLVLPQNSKSWARRTDAADDATHRGPPRRIQYGYTRDLRFFEGSALSIEVSIGNRWTYKWINFGVDWIGYVKPVSTKIYSNFGATDSDIGNYLSDAQFEFLRTFPLGWCSSARSARVPKCFFARFGDDATTRCFLNQTLLQEIGLVDVFERVFFFAQSGR